MQQFEALPPEPSLEELKNWMTKLELVIAQKEKALGKAPEGWLRVSQCRGVPQYFHIFEQGDKKGRYIPRKESKLAKRLAQKSYDAKVFKKSAEKQKQLQLLMEQFESDSIRQIYQGLSSNRKSLVNPATLPDEEYIRRWQDFPYCKKDFKHDVPEYLTTTNLRVRSKSELLIAEYLIKENIPFRYEFPLELKRPNGKTFTAHPDFCVLNIIKRKEIYWEHFGMMDNPEYATHAIEKILAYQRSGLVPGKDIIFTWETVATPLNSDTVRQIVRQYLG